MILVMGSEQENEWFLIGMITDVTQRRLADSEVRKSELKYRRLIEGISHIIFTADNRGKITYLSPVIRHVLGYEPGELIGKHFFTLVPSDTRHPIGMLLNDALEGKSIPSDFSLIDKDGSSHWVRIIAQPNLEADHVIGVCGLMGDINDWKNTKTALANCELKYKAVVEDQSELICRFLPDFRIVFANPAFCHFFMKKEDVVLRNKILNFLTVKYQDLLPAQLAELTADHPSKTQRLELISPNGVLYYFHMTIRAIFNNNGEKTEFQVSCRDITELMAYFKRSQYLLEELKVNETELIAQNSELERLKALAEASEVKFFNLYQSIPVACLLLESSGKIVECNPTGASFIGKPTDQIIGHPFADLLCAENRSQLSSYLKNILETGTPQKWRTSIQNGDSSLVPVTIEGFCCTMLNHPPLCQMILSEHSEQKNLPESSAARPMISLM